jgi:hypothetical protein
MIKKINPNEIQHGGEHYKKLDVSPWDVIDSFPLEQRIGAYRGNAVKYILRMGHKDNSLLEVKKAIHYLEKLRDVLEEQIEHSND